MECIVVFRLLIAAQNPLQVQEQSFIVVWAQEAVLTWCPSRGGGQVVTGARVISKTVCSLGLHLELKTGTPTVGLYMVP